MDNKFSPLKWPDLVAYMRRNSRQVDKIQEITAAPKFLFESGGDLPADARRVNAECAKLIAAGGFQFSLPAPQVFIEDPIHGGSGGRQFYLCTQDAQNITIWGVSEMLGQYIFSRTPKIISLTDAGRWQDDVNSPTIAVKEFIMAIRNPLAAKLDMNGYTHVGWVKGLTETAPGGFENFIDTLRKGEVQILTPGVTTRSFFEEDDPNRWSVPVYDFGQLLNAGEAGALDANMISALAEDAPDMEPPAKSCVFLFRSQPDPIRGQMTSLVLVDGVLPNGRPNITFECAHIQRHLRHRDFTIEPGYWSVMIGVEEEAKEIAEKVELACSILSSWRDNYEIRMVGTYRTGVINKKRASAKQTPIEMTQTIHITQQRIVYLREQTETRAYAKTDRTMPQHYRNITDRWVYPKGGKRQFRPYQRTPKVVVVNSHVAPRAAQYLVVP